MGPQHCQDSGRMAFNASVVASAGHWIKSRVHFRRQSNPVSEPKLNY